MNATAGLVTNVSVCSECGVAAHAVALGNRKRRIHDLEEFSGMTCFAIMHCAAGRTIWMPTTTSEDTASHAFCHSAPIVKKLRVLYGLSAEIKRPKMADDSSNK